jgi:hypothetical protein
LAGASHDNDEEYFHKIWAHKAEKLVERLEKYNLVLHINTSALPSDNATEVLKSSIESHLSFHRITMPSSPDLPVIRLGQTDLQSNFSRLGWKLVTIGYRKPASGGLTHLLNLSDIAYYEMTWHRLLSKAPGTPGKDLIRLKNPINDWPLVFIGTKLMCMIHYLQAHTHLQHPLLAS